MEFSSGNLVLLKNETEDTIRLCLSHQIWLHGEAPCQILIKCIHRFRVVCELIQAHITIISDGVSDDFHNSTINFDEMRFEAQEDIFLHNVSTESEFSQFYLRVEINEATRVGNAKRLDLCVLVLQELVGGKIC